MGIFDVLNRIAFGGNTSGLFSPLFAVVAHGHRDHVPADRNLRLVGPVSFKNRRFDYIPYNFSEVYSLGGGEYVKVFVFGDRTLRNFGVSERLHAPPVLVTYFQARRGKVLEEESALYVEDFDLRDVPKVVRIVEELALRVNLRVVVLPAYSGARSHGAEDEPKKLSDASRELAERFLEEGYAVVLLSHPVQPAWTRELKAKYGDRLRVFDRNLEVLADTEGSP